MFGLPLAFSVPLVLGALLALPALYYLLRLTPPRPRQVAFPPLKLILDLKPKEETPARTPWWLLALRLAIAALVILAMAGPIWNPPPRADLGQGPLLVILDDDWAAAKQWDRRITAASEAIGAAARQGQRGALATISEGGRSIAFANPQTVVERLRAMQPQPYTADRMAVLEPVKAFLSANSGAQILWIASGLEHGGARAFAEGLQAAAGESASIRVILPETLPTAVVSAANTAGALEVVLRRAETAGSGQGVVRAFDLRGLNIGQAPFAFGDDGETRARFDLPIELRNEIARIEIEGERTAGAVTLLDSRWKRRRVALLSGETADTAQPLLASTYYLSNALAPFADVREPRADGGDRVLAALEDQPSVVVLADIGTKSDEARIALTSFIENGGVLLRFAGTRLAAASAQLTPVTLRRGGRVLGGAMSWDQPRKLAPFERGSPFYGLDAPEEVTVLRQVLAEPEAGLPGKTWAALDDGTPLVTASRRGKGLIVLVHVTADTTWSNLPLSGLYVEILRRVLAMAGESDSGGATATSNVASERAPVTRETAAPSRILNGFGELGDPPATARPIPVNFSGAPERDHPPGFYGPQDALIALNTLKPDDRLVRADLTGLNMERVALHPSDPVDLRPWIIAAALLLLLADALASLWLAGGLGRGGRSRAVPAGRAGAVVAAGLLAALAAAPLTSGGALAQPAAGAQNAGELRPLTQEEMQSVLQTRLAYVITGESEVDRASRLGLQTVSRALHERTALSPGSPRGVDPARDELSFYPMLYWPIVPTRPQPPQEAINRLKAYMQHGGTVIFDTRDAPRNRPGGAPTAETAWLRVLLAGVDVPQLEPLPRDHVVTKTFYLLDRVTGRHSIGQTWIEALPPLEEGAAIQPARAGDSVSPIVITSNDLAAAWAHDERGAALYPMSGDGPRAREFAIRSGVNLVMYTLTGNYKTDQVHARDILERLGL